MTWTALCKSLFGSLPLLSASHVVTRVHLDPGNSNQAPTGNMEEREEKQIKRVENAVESKQKRRRRWHMALTFHQHWGDLKMGKGKAPSESNVSTRDIRHQAQSTSASVFNRTRQGSTYLGTETKRWILASTSGCGFLLLPPRAWLKSWHRSRGPQFHAASVWAQDNESRDRLPVGTPMSLTPLQGSGHSQRSNSGGPRRPTASGSGLGKNRRNKDTFMSSKVHAFPKNWTRSL